MSLFNVVIVLDVKCIKFEKQQVLFLYILKMLHYDLNFTFILNSKCTMPIQQKRYEFKPYIERVIGQFKVHLHHCSQFQCVILMKI